jgi:hypothetical protein
MKTDNLIADIVFGIIFSTLGFNFIFRRGKIVNALMASSKVFWENIGFRPNERQGMLITKIMIPVMGAIFSIVGIVLVYRAITHFIN